ncbi:hypothetical protein SHKM778_65010 [Streptomyces sp. KM77-8]|uniref:Uncharacterized protein n=1 Tax=Streptomyces haneummycinicus TaxID=3074435 RepID=A0AAT9HS28_9ACTN
MLAEPGHAQAVAGAGPDDRGEDGGEQGVHDGVHAHVVHGVGAEDAGLGEQREADQDGDGEGAADPGGGDGAGHGLAGDGPDDGAEHPAAVQGRPGSRLKTATMRLETIRPASRTPGTLLGSTASSAR